MNLDDIKNVCINYMSERNTEQKRDWRACENNDKLHAKRIKIIDSINKVDFYKLIKSNKIASSYCYWLGFIYMDEYKYLIRVNHFVDNRLYDYEKIQDDVFNNGGIIINKILNYSEKSIFYHQSSIEFYKSQNWFKNDNIIGDNNYQIRINLEDQLALAYYSGKNELFLKIS